MDAASFVTAELIVYWCRYENTVPVEKRNLECRDVCVRSDWFRLLHVYR
jgi:hypothetical protein